MLASIRWTQKRIVQLLLARDADPLLPTLSHRNALSIAKEKGYPNIVEKITRESHTSQTPGKPLMRRPFFRSVAPNHLASIRACLSIGVDVDAMDYDAIDGLVDCKLLWNVGKW